MSPKDLSDLITLKTAESEGVSAEGPDHVIEIDNKSLTHRPDLWGHYGMAREVAAILRKPLRDPVKLDVIPQGDAGIRVSIEDFILCPRYSALVFENVAVQPSPDWLQHRLEAIGLNPINNIVDVTNYVMAEIAQPMHAFDADKLTGGITVRRARAGEWLTALNGENYELSEANLVIADDTGAVAIAGVIGGLDSAIGPDTKRIVLESANFQATSVRRTSSALKLRTDASMRFEKAQDPENTIRGLARAVELLKQDSPGIRIAGGLADRRQAIAGRAAIELSLPWLIRKLGREIDAPEVRAILEALGFGVEEARPDTFLVRIPSWRATKDISIKDDLVEEIGRMVGYVSITPHSPLLPAAVPAENTLREYLHRLREVVVDQGYYEVYNYSFLSDDTAREFGLDPADLVRVANPIASDQALLRNSLVPGIWKNIVENSRYSDSFRLFEVGREIHKRDGGLPRESNHVAAAIYYKEDGADGLFELKRLAECIHRELQVRPAQALHFEHPARTAQVMLRGEPAGRLFEFHPSFMRGRASVLDLDVDLLMRLRDPERRYRPPQRFPTSAFDLSVVADSRALVGDIQLALAESAGDGLQDIEFVRQYSGPPLPEGKKSVSYRLTIGAADRTLSSEEVGSIRARLIEEMRRLGYDLRV